MMFHTHDVILGIQVPITTTTRNGKQITTNGWIDDNDYILYLPNKKHKVLEYSALIDMINKTEEGDHDIWTFEAIKDHRAKI